jgi:hypothetical protein
MNAEKSKVTIPVVIGALAIAVALGSVNEEVIVEIGKQPTPYSADHARLMASDAPIAEQPPTF